MYTQVYIDPYTNSQKYMLIHKCTQIHILEERII